MDSRHAGGSPECEIGSRHRRRSSRNRRQRSRDSRRDLTRGKLGRRCPRHVEEGSAARFVEPAKQTPPASSGRADDRPRIHATTYFLRREHQEAEERETQRDRRRREVLSRSDAERKRCHHRTALAPEASNEKRDGLRNAIRSGRAALLARPLPVAVDTKSTAGNTCRSAAARALRRARGLDRREVGLVEPGLDETRVVEDLRGAPVIAQRDWGRRDAVVETPVPSLLLPHLLRSLSTSTREIGAIPDRRGNSGAPPSKSACETSRWTLVHAER